MYIKKVKGPTSVKLPDGTVLTRADLPDPDTRRWVASRKAIVARAVQFDLISPEEACKLYDLSTEELESWVSALDRHGAQALKTTVLQRYRQL